MRRTPWSRVQGCNRVNKVKEIVGHGKPTGNARKETIALSDTKSISMQNRHSRILVRREPEVPEAQAQEGKWLDGRARISSMELARIHFVKNGILQNACSTSPRVVVDLEKVLFRSSPS